MPDNSVQGVALLDGERVVLSGNFKGTLTAGATVTQAIPTQTLGYFLMLEP